MKIFGLSAFLLLFSFQSVKGQKESLADETHTLPEGIYAKFNTNQGNFLVKLEYEKNPMTVANFIGLAEGTISNSTYPAATPFFNGSIWHRVVKGHVIQGGEPSVVKDPAGFEGNSTGYEIPDEISDLSHNKAGMIGMANGGPNTATCEYYITLADRSYLDGNYTLFGEVVDGMEVINKIEKGDTTKSINIIREGSAAENFRVTDEIFRKLVENQWKKVNSGNEARKIETEKYISSNYLDAIRLPDGLRYKIQVRGKGDCAGKGSLLKAVYYGSLINGTRFVSSAEEGKPADGENPEEFSFIQGNDLFIKGLKEVLGEMKEGERRLVIIPSEFGTGTSSPFYGKESAGHKRLVIGPGETLILDVTVNKIFRSAK